MPAKPVQISIDEELLDRIDADPEAREKGRSAFVRTAVERYLDAKQRREIERQIASAYGQRAGAMLDEIAAVMDAQEWPAD
jgi:metal-responsive CopG/Arc/MetJ family transcriptional regulator